MINYLPDNISISRRHIFFDSAAHKYTDEFSNEYTSVTTVIGKYSNKFDTKTVARACYKSGLNGNPKYAGKSEKMLAAQWKQASEDACREGNITHDFNDVSIKEANGFFRSAKSTGKYLTLYDILTDVRFGVIDTDILATNGFADKYPDIYGLICQLVAEGYHIYSEVGVYNPDWLISGTIDIVAINFANRTCIIVDWKTNKAPIVFDASGYFEKDVNGELTNNYITTNKWFKIPGVRLADSVGNKYAIQVSTYGLLVELLGFEFLGAFICHLPKKTYTAKDIESGVPLMYLNKPVVNIITSPNLIKEARIMCEDFSSKLTKRNQLRLV